LRSCIASNQEKLTQIREAAFCVLIGLDPIFGTKRHMTNHVHTDVTNIVWGLVECCARA
jgi:hypothetical protein